MNEQAGQPEAVRSLLLPLQGPDILVPYSVVQEIVAWREPSPLPNAPEWVLGAFQWRNWRLPVISAERLLGGDFTPPRRKAHIAVCSLLTGDERMPCVGIVTQTVPQLVRPEPEILSPFADYTGSPVVLERLYYRHAEVWIPDLPALAAELGSALT